MRAIQVWRWAVPPTGGHPVKVSAVLRIPEPQIDRTHSLMMSAWRVNPNHLPPPTIIDAPEPEPIPGWDSLFGQQPSPIIPPAGDPSLERFTAEQLVEMGTCPDCPSQVWFEKLPQLGLFVYRPTTVHASTCPTFRQLTHQSPQPKGNDR